MAIPGDANRPECRTCDSLRTVLPARPGAGPPDTCGPNGASRRRGGGFGLGHQLTAVMRTRSTSPFWMRYLHSPQTHSRSQFDASIRSTRRSRVDSAPRSPDPFPTKRTTRVTQGCGSTAYGGRSFRGRVVRDHRAHARRDHGRAVPAGRLKTVLSCSLNRRRV